MIEQLENLPEVSFIDNIGLDNIKANLINNYQTKYEELTGVACTLEPSDPVALILYAVAVQLYQELLYADRAGKMNLIKYSYGDYLDNIAALKGVVRLPAEAAKTTVRFTLSAIQGSAVGIPEGTRVKAGNMYFTTDDYSEVPAGSLYVDVPCTCETLGEAGNEIPIGSINALADSVPFIESVSNITESSGGAEIENDEDLSERIFLAPSGYSVAGPMDAYRYFVYECNPKAHSVVVTTPSACAVNVYVLMEDGELPTQAERADIEAYLSEDTRRPLTDTVSVLAPSTTSFDVTLTYYINRSDNSEAASIQEEVESAIDNYIDWQTTEIGRDINPSVLESLVMDAGAKRVVVTSPTFAVVGETTVPVLGAKTITYGGIEDD